MPKLKTYFEQVSLEVVNKIVGNEEQKRNTTAPARGAPKKKPQNHTSGTNAADGKGRKS